MMGRPPKPTVLKVLGGTDQPCRLRPDEMRPAALRQIPMAPPELEGRGVEEWYVVCGELYALKMLHAADMSLLAAYCNEVSIYWECEALLRKNGRITKATRKDGSTYITQVPHVAIGRNALKMAHQLAAQFGFTPAARTRISQPKADSDALDPLAQILADMKA